MRSEWNWLGSEHWRTHSQVYWRLQYVEDDEVTPVTSMESLVLAGTLRTIAQSPTVTVDLTPYFSWTANAHLTCDIPAGALSAVAEGIYELEIVGTGSGQTKSLVIGQVELRKSTHRPAP